MGDDTASSLDRLSPARVRTLLDLAAGPADMTGLAAQAGDPPVLRRLLSELCEGEAQSAEFVLATLCTKETPLAVLRDIKGLAKQLVGVAASRAHRDAATVLYHAAIAAGVAHHATNLSSRPLEPRAPLYEELAVALAADPLGGLFAEAAMVAGDVPPAVR
jgi:hypothetical protein